MEFRKLSLISISVVAFGALLWQPAVAKDITEELREPDMPSAAFVHEADALVAAQKGDWEAEVALAAKAYRERDTVQNEFNLATGYEHTGRTILAIPLYEDIRARGQYVPAMAVYDYRNAPPVEGRRIDSTLGMEAARRLNRIAGRPAPFNP